MIDILTMHVLKSRIRDEIDWFLPGELEAIMGSVEAVLQEDQFYCCIHHGQPLKENNDGTI